LQFYIRHQGSISSTNLHIFFAQNNQRFFNEWRMANGTKIWRILGHKFDEIGCAIFAENVGEIERQFFAKCCVPSSFCLAKKFG
jgi:hypothetical protein